MNFSLWKIPIYVIVISLSLIFVWGIALYPDAPISPCAAGFCGKWGRLHTAAEYHHFLIWQTVFLWTWVPAGLAGALYKLLGYDKRSH